jgi:hypothetical protein
MQYFEHVEGVSEKIHIVVNRVGLEDTQISLNKALETIGREIAWQIPNDFATMVDNCSWSFYVEATFEGDHRGNDVAPLLNRVFEAIAQHASGLTNQAFTQIRGTEWSQMAIQKRAGFGDPFKKTW